MPADRRAGRIFGDKHLLDRSGRETGKGFRARAKAGEKFRHILRFGKAAAVKIIAPAERHDPALPGKALKLELPEWQGHDKLQKELFFLLAQEIRLISETCGKSIISKKIERAASAWHAFFSGQYFF